MGSGKQCRKCAALNELGLKAGASEASIKSAYRKEIKEWHPDRHGKDKAGQFTAEERTKRINVAYRYLTSPSKKGDAQTTRYSSTTPEASRPKSSSTTSNSAKRQSEDSAQPPSGKGYKREQPLKANKTSVVQARPPKETASTYPRQNFEKWNARFHELLINGSNAAKGLTMWIAHVEAQRLSNIAFVENHYRSIGIEPNLNGLDKSEDVKADVMRRLWSESVPDMKERTRALNNDIFLVEKMEELAKRVDDVVTKLQSHRPTMSTKSGYLEIPLDRVMQHCVQLSSSIHKVTYSFREKLIDQNNVAKNKLPYPFDIADSCLPLVFEMEETYGIPQRECHELIKCALRAHGCTREEASVFDGENVQRGTIRAKKEATKKKIIDSLNIMFANGVRPAPIRMRTR